MQREDFLDFNKVLKESLQIPHSNENGDKLYWANIQWLRYDKGFGKCKYKMSLKEEDPSFIMDFNRMRKRSSSQAINLKEQYSGPVAISKEKKKDLVSILNLIDPLFHNFYLDLRTDDDLLSFNLDPDLEEE